MWATKASFAWNKNKRKNNMIIKVKEGKNISYVVDEIARTVTCNVTSKNEVFTGKSVCDMEDEFDVEKGKKIAYIKAEIAQRKADYCTDATFQEYAKKFISDEAKNGNRTSKLAMKAIQECSESMHTQSIHISLCKDMLKAVQNDVEFVFDEKKYGCLRRKKVVEGAEDAETEKLCKE